MRRSWRRSCGAMRMAMSCFALPETGRPTLRARRLKNESWSEVSDRIDGWWNQIPPLDSRSEPWSKCRKEKRFFQVRKKRALAARTVYVSLDKADVVIEPAALFPHSPHVSLFYFP